MKRLFNFVPKASIMAIVAIICFSSCASKQDLLYFQDEALEGFSQPVIRPEISYQPGDLLTIDVSGLDQESVRPFNLPVVSYQNSSLLSVQQDATKQAYLIDKNGSIEFPVLGPLKLEGLTRIEATELIKGKLEDYVKNAIVNIRLANFTISVLGEVKNPGTYTILDERVSLTEALGLAGDLTVFGNRKNILLIREVEGQKRFAKFDLTSVKALASPNYYLAQNDVIYIEPNQARVNSSKYNENSAIIISAVATLATIAAILIK